MPDLAAPLSHIVRDAQGVAWVDETNVKVLEIALDHLAYGWSADAMHEQFPHLTLGQIHAALAFFYDHQEEFEREMLRREREVAGGRAEAGESALQRRLRLLKAQTCSSGFTWMCMCRQASCGHCVVAESMC